jgi:hypothetical protein
MIYGLDVGRVKFAPLSLKSENVERNKIGSTQTLKRPLNLKLAPNSFRHFVVN